LQFFFQGVDFRHQGAEALLLHGRFFEPGLVV
jgi:hypothetical protein